MRQNMLTLLWGQAGCKLGSTSVTPRGTQGVPTPAQHPTAHQHELPAGLLLHVIPGFGRQVRKMLVRCAIAPQAAGDAGGKHWVPGAFPSCQLPQGKLNSLWSDVLAQHLRPSWLVQLLICSCWEKINYIIDR